MMPTRNMTMSERMKAQTSGAQSTGQGMSAMTGMAGMQGMSGMQGISSQQSAQQMSSSQIANPESPQLPQVKGPEMNDRDFLNDALSTCKYLTDSLNIAVREASHQELHVDMLQILNDTHRSARELYNLMFQKGWYKLEAEQQQKLQQAHQQFSGYSSQFPYQ